MHPRRSRWKEIGWHVPHYGPVARISATLVALTTLAAAALGTEPVAAARLARPGGIQTITPSIVGSPTTRLTPVPAVQPSAVGIEHGPSELRAGTTNPSPILHPLNLASQVQLQAPQIIANVPLALTPVGTALSPSLGRAVTYVVGGSCAAGTTEPDLQTALNVARSGDTIDVCASGGPYLISGTGNPTFGAAYVVFQNRLTIQGVGGSAVFNASSTNYYGFVLLGAGDVLRNLTVQGAATSLPSQPGIAVIVEGIADYLTNLTLTNNDVGTYISSPLAGGFLNGVTETSTAPNQHAGLWVDNHGTATVRNSTFDNNSTGVGYGAYVSNGGNLIATGNTSFSTDLYDGIAVPSSSVPSLILLTGATVNGNHVDNFYDGAPGQIKVINSSFNNSVGDNGLHFDSGATGDVYLRDVAADGNWNNGLYDDGTGSLTVDGASGANQFNNNVGNSGILVDTTVAGAVTLNGVTANGNWNCGLYDGGSGALTITSSTFNGNKENNGIDVASSVAGAVYLRNVTADGNYDNGLYDGGPSTLTVDAVSEFNNNLHNNGMYVANSVAGAVRLSGVTADGNDNNGLYDDGTGTLAVGAGSGANAFSNNTGNDGLFIDGPVTGVTLSNVSANGNTNNGLYDDATGPLTINGTNTFNNNADNDGLYIDSPVTAVTISGLTADGNAGNGLFDDGTGAHRSAAAPSVTPPRPTATASRASSWPATLPRSRWRM